jgi:hypothetical protein
MGTVKILPSQVAMLWQLFQNSKDIFSYYYNLKHTYQLCIKHKALDWTVDPVVVAYKLLY